MPGIPAASLRGVDLDRLRRDHPVQAEEISRIGLLMNQGEETDEDFRQLCQLLYDVGCVAKSEELLRANAKEGDNNHALYMRLHGTLAEEKLIQAVDYLERQFGIALTRLRSPRYLNVVYSSKPLSVPSDVEKRLFALLTKEAEVDVIYYGPGEIVADVFEMASDESVAVKGQPLVYDHGVWKVQDV
jgi:hypothetical protein